MKFKRRISISAKVIFVITLAIVLIVGLILVFDKVSNTLDGIVNPELEDKLNVIKGLLSILIFLNISFIALLGKTMYDVYSQSKVNAYVIEVNKMTNIIDQQTQLDKLDFWNDKFIKMVIGYSKKIRDVDLIYEGLMQIYKIKSMKTAYDFEKIKMYTNILMKAYAESYNIRNVYTEKKIHKISEAAVMYDIGKLGTPGHILYREASLSTEDFNIAKRHAEVGFNILAKIKTNIRNGTFEQYARDIAGYHHERYDGTGYPFGKHGEEIPFIARIIAVITTYDTITNDRPYCKAMTHNEAVLLINNEKGRYFDPKIVKIFNAVEKEIEKIKSKDLD